MLKKLMTAAVLGLGLGAFVAPIVMPVSPAVAATDEEIADRQADIEGLIAENAEDADALEVAIREYVANSADPEGAALAFVGAVTNPKTDAAKTALQKNSGLKSAAARGLGAAIALIAVSQPQVAASMQAVVESSGDATLVAAVSEGNATQTASINGGSGVEDNASQVVTNANDNNTTPEAVASAN